ncbi:EF-hand domain-containing protein [Arvimicrobium flavum]|uniref:EF-hand domain-containing protein n=1 Tax=Arvimicrobium flavum TaxID=3393320 RepID=UPI00237AAB4D|nr:acid-shock protein [Mesorhizobium shangrilense]
MRKTTRYALAFAAVASALGTAAVAQDGTGKRGHHQSRLERADVDKSGDVTFEEFAAAINGRFGGADANGDGRMTVAEIADEIQRMRAERMAKRMVERFDVNGDGELTKAEVEARQKKMFALLDRNDDGRIAQDEMPARGEGRRR